MFKLILVTLAAVAVVSGEPSVEPLAYAAPVGSYASYLPSAYAYNTPALTGAAVGAPVYNPYAYSAYGAYAPHAYRAYAPSAYPLSYGAYNGHSHYAGYSPLTYGSYWNPASIYYKRK